MGRFEKIIETVSPSWAASRAQARRAKLQNEIAAEQLRKYEAAAGGRRTSGVIATGASANVEISSSAAITRNRARQLVRDNALAANAVTVIANNTIGKGISPEISGRTKIAEKRASERWNAWAGSTQCDADGAQTFAGIESLVMRTVVESGSCLVRRRIRSSAAGLSVPLQIQVIEPDYLDTTKDHSGTEKQIIRGKQYDAKTGKLEGYWIYTEHPGQANSLAHFGKSVFVPAEEILHIFRQDRPGQVDGITWFAPVMNTIRDLMDTRDAYQLRQKIAACFTAFVHDMDAQGLGGGGGQHDPITDHVEPGLVQVLPPGKNVTFASPPGVDGMADFDRLQQIAIASGLGVPYEALSGDLRNVSFLSGRLGWLAFYRNIDSWRNNMIIPQLCAGVFRWFAEAVEIELLVSGVQNPQLSATWTPPDRDMLDPEKELAALRDEQRLGALPWSELVRMRGRDPEKVLEQIKKWNKAFDDAEIVTDGDPRRMSRAGNTNTENPAESKEPAKPEKDEAERRLDEALARALDSLQDG